MKKVKKMVVPAIFGIEICIFLGFYLYGPHGIKSLHRLEKENEQLKFEIVQMQEEVNSFEQKIMQFKTFPFYKEKIAREQLQMACKGEEIYYIK